MGRAPTGGTYVQGANAQADVVARSAVHRQRRFYLAALPAILPGHSRGAGARTISVPCSGKPGTSCLADRKIIFIIQSVSYILSCDQRKLKTVAASRRLCLKSSAANHLQRSVRHRPPSCLRMHGIEAKYVSMDSGHSKHVFDGCPSGPTGNWGVPEKDAVIERSGQHIKDELNVEIGASFSSGARSSKSLPHGVAPCSENLVSDRTS